MKVKGPDTYTSFKQCTDIERAFKKKVILDLAAGPSNLHFALGPEAVASLAAPYRRHWSTVPLKNFWGVNSLNIVVENANGMMLHNISTSYI